MADFSKTISNRINLFGGESPNEWGTMLWGQNWGYGNGELSTTTLKRLSETLSLDDATTLQLFARRIITNALTVTGDMGGEMISDNAGYLLVFGGSTNAEMRPNTSYTRTSETTASFVTAITTHTTWTVL